MKLLALLLTIGGEGNPRGVGGGEGRPINPGPPFNASLPISAKGKDISIIKLIHCNYNAEHHIEKCRGELANILP